MSAVARMTGRLLGRGLPGLIALLLGVALFELIQALVIDSLGGPQGLTSLLDALPPALRAFTRTQPQFLALSGLAGYLSLGFTHPLYLVLACSTVVGFACRSLAGEMEHGTIQLALSRPLSRPRVYGARVLGLLAIVVGLAIIGPLGLIAGLLYARPAGTFDVGHLVPTAIASGLLFWAIGGLTLCGSAAASTSGRAVAWAIAGLIVSYFVDYFADIWTILKRFEVLSVFNYYDPARTLVSGTLGGRDVATLALAGVLGVVGGLLIFVRRDLPV
jgi:ABC-2 type transport system permease protein